MRNQQRSIHKKSKHFPTVAKPCLHVNVESYKLLYGKVIVICRQFSDLIITHMQTRPLFGNNSSQYTKSRCGGHFGTTLSKSANSIYMKPGKEISLYIDDLIRTIKGPKNLCYALICADGVALRDRWTLDGRPAKLECTAFGMQK